uniref:Uncharacterized protein n=1 Tax=Aegilops tauschii subsp. strangulata TaxID=200361 RepID=A0A452YLZ1_AEGTS
MPTGRSHRRAQELPRTPPDLADRAAACRHWAENVRTTARWIWPGPCRNQTGPRRRSPELGGNAPKLAGPHRRAPDRPRMCRDRLARATVRGIWEEPHQGGPPAPPPVTNAYKGRASQKGEHHQALQVRESTAWPAPPPLAIRRAPRRSGPPTARRPGP